MPVGGVEVDAVGAGRELSGIGARSAIKCVVAKGAVEPVVVVLSVEDVVGVIARDAVVAGTRVDVFDGDQTVCAITCVLPVGGVEVDAVGAGRELSCIGA